MKGRYVPMYRSDKEKMHRRLNCDSDFNLKTSADVPELPDEYVYYFNNRRPSAALCYKSPVQYKTELGF